MSEHIYHQYGLSTPTDFNWQCKLLTSYMEYVIEFHKPVFETLDIFHKTGLLFYGSTTPSFDEWKKSHVRGNFVFGENGGVEFQLDIMGNWSLSSVNDHNFLTQQLPI